MCWQRLQRPLLAGLCWSSAGLCGVTVARDETETRGERGSEREGGSGRASERESERGREGASERERESKTAGQTGEQNRTCPAGQPCCELVHVMLSSNCHPVMLSVPPIRSHCDGGKTPCALTSQPVPRPSFIYAKIGQNYAKIRQNRPKYAKIRQNRPKLVEHQSKINRC